MVAIIGLGNPGSEYENTRHNLGFAVIDLLAEKLNIHLDAGKGDYLIGFGSFHSNDIGLVKPLTYMNNSGLAVLDLTERYKLQLHNCLVVCDDVNLSLGRIRLRPKGNDGGHNGLYSIIYHLQTEEFPRLRCGISRESTSEKKLNTAEFVLSVFEEHEKKPVHTMVMKAQNAALCFAQDGIDIAMNRFNS